MQTIYQLILIIKQKEQKKRRNIEQAPYAEIQGYQEFKKAYSKA